MPYELSGYKWGDPQLGESGGKVYWSADLTGLNYDTNLYTEQQFEDALRDAFQAWEDVCGINFVETTDPSKVDLFVEMEPLAGDTVGLASVSFFDLPPPNYDQIDSATVFMDQDELWVPDSDTDFSFYSVALHEIGHAIGLDHDEDPTQIMHDIIFATDLGAQDIAGARAIYGILCFAAGTMIDTPDGPKAAETLAIGDLVLTRDRGAQPLRWVGTRRLDASDMAARPDLAPVRIRAGALGPDLPAADVTVSPAHRVLLADWRAEVLYGMSECLAPAQDLVNDHTILRDRDADGVTYVHLMFDQHEIVTSQGLASESFHPGLRGMTHLEQATRDEILALFPELGSDFSAYGGLARPILNTSETRAYAEGLSR